jgi:hypothetical protein
MAEKELFEREIKNCYSHTDCAFKGVSSLCVGYSCKNQDNCRFQKPKKPK